MNPRASLFAKPQRSHRPCPRDVENTIQHARKACRLEHQFSTQNQIVPTTYWEQSTCEDKLSCATEKCSIHGLKCVFTSNICHIDRQGLVRSTASSDIRIDFARLQDLTISQTYCIIHDRFYGHVWKSNIPVLHITCHYPPYSASCKTANAAVLPGIEHHPIKCQACPAHPWQRLAQCVRLFQLPRPSPASKIVYAHCNRYFIDIGTLIKGSLGI